jgi:hypothetical protein
MILLGAPEARFWLEIWVLADRYQLDESRALSGIATGAVEAQSLVPHSETPFGAKEGTRIAHGPHSLMSLCLRSYHCCRPLAEIARLSKLVVGFDTEQVLASLLLACQTVSPGSRNCALIDQPCVVSL